MNMPAVLKTGRLYVITGTIQILTGLLTYIFPQDFQSKYYASLLGHLSPLSIGLIAGGITLLICTRYGMNRWVHRTLVLFPASVLLILAFLLYRSGGVTGAVVYSVLAAGLVAGAWVIRPTDDDPDPMDLFALIIGTTLGLIGLLSLGAPHLFSSDAFWLVRPALPLAGVLGLAGAGALILPDGPRWLRPRSGWRLILASVLPLWLTVTFVTARAWTGAHWLIIALGILSYARPELFFNHRRHQPAEESDPGTAHLDIALEAWNWGLASVVAALTSVHGTDLASHPLRSSLFVSGLVVYNLMMYWMFPHKIHPRNRALIHLSFLILAVGFLLPGGGPATKGFLPVLVMAPVLATRVAGPAAGWRMLALAMASLAGAGLESWLSPEVPQISPTELLVEMLVLVVVAAGGLASTSDHVRAVRELATTRFSLQRQVLQMSLVDRIGRNIRSSLDLDETLRTAVRELGQALDADRCYLQLSDGNRFLPVLHQYVRSGVPALDPLLAERCPFVGLAVGERRIVAIPDVKAAMAEVAATSMVPGTPLPDLPVVLGCLAVPLFADSGLIGAVAFHQYGRSRDWSQEEIEFVEGVATQLSVAIVHARAHRELSIQHGELVEAHEHLKEQEEELLRRQAALQEREQLFHTAFRNAPIGMAMVDTDGRFLQVNEALSAMLGYSEAELLGMDVARITHPEDRRNPRTLLAAGVEGSMHWEKRYIHKDGHFVWASASLSMVRDAQGDPLYYVGHVQDVTDRKRSEAQLIEMANFDSLTSLFNRRRFHEELERALAHSVRYGTRGALFFLDLDQFKYLNDSMGHQAGDRVLRNLGLLLRKRLRRTDVVARLGGDEFAVLLMNVDEKKARQIAESLIRAIREHREILDGHAVGMTSSIGIALFPAHGTTVEELLSRADLAMYQAKEDGRNRFAIFSPESGRAARIGSRLAWERRIREALDQNRFVLHAQPILSLATGHIRQYELLLRMVGENNEVVPPGAFLDVAERFGMIQEIDRWVVRQAIKLLAAWNRQGPSICLEVNLSGKAFNDPELLPLIRQELAESGADPANLVLEITETAAIADIAQARQFVETLREIGCRFALDDFGSGFSSFFYLKHLPVDYLKIDGSFIQNLPKDPMDQKLVSTVVSLARGLGKQTIAEFVSDEATVEMLHAMGVDYAQGYHVGKPGIFSELKMGRK